MSASCLMPMLTYYGVGYARHSVSQHTRDIAVLHVFMVQFGSVLFVKTMIRDGEGRTSWPSDLAGAVMLAWWTFVGNGYLIALAAMLLIRRRR